ncbi:1-deoxy-D-xylulose-5-phosphate synthase [Maridesulfovibrio hydrothermalis]|uniref:1-deoxy-D-xylulose-5-phosphate synthase n=1 Tax=Maridesulfovibrio hydrothermalis AM13 = DSM 14728 TaxID=1121451 RepID=L0RA73_9BACT|nr:1-deoxy-D-xylulose-5-phosphate synthase [Maridesulfovibrio hydrothermalis]CCO22451.1 1-deoxyxylulose-5-phosphate synthase [Maridesulfovibrio hydrothermalis AM13 = DSM 14728]
MSKNDASCGCGEFPLLQKIKNPAEVKELSKEQLVQLAEELRQCIINTVSKGGGHLAPSLGVIELTLALFSCFDLDKDRLVWDVGHQAYAHKILTGRYENFHTLRQKDGISGFPRMAENSYDHFGVGHSSTSISAALGMAFASDIEGDGRNCVAVIGDGSMTAGQAFEGLNQAGGMKRKMVVVLNDNEMSISTNVGALSAYLSRKLSHPVMNRFKKDFESLLKQIPKIGDDLAMYAKRGEDSFKSFFTPGMLFESLDFTYLGPIDGHNLQELIDVFEQVKKIDSPVLVHVLTTKGKGYTPAEDNPTYFHGVGSFEPETGRAKKFKGGLPSYTEVFGKTLCKLAEKDDKIVAITAAMPEGTGTSPFREQFPERFVDVGICEQHAVTFAAGLATMGYKPAVAIYSTFLQRSYDQVVHDVCLQNLNVNFFLDRGGLVGADGATHHGVFDISFLRHIPNIVCMAPKDEAELARMIATAIDYDGPAAVRYPRGVGIGTILEENPRILEIGEGELLRDGFDGVIITVGSRVWPAIEAVEELDEEFGKAVAVFNTRFIKPLPEKQILELASRFKKILIVEENAKAGGFSSAVIEILVDNNAIDGHEIKRLGIPDEFIEHGTQQELRGELGIDKNGMKKSMLELLSK